MNKRNIATIISGTLLIGGLLNIFFVFFATLFSDGFTAFQIVIFSVSFAVSSLIVSLTE